MATSMPSYHSNEHWKGVDFQSSVRLHLQHWIWLYTLGYTIDPKINLPKDKPVRIADVACCNGAWMLDLHREYPNAVIDGFDLTPAHFPGAGWLPSNIKFHEWDAFTEVPKEYIGVFDVVHIRAIYSAIIENKVEPLLVNLLKMLKPGGYIQWDESDSKAMKASVPAGSKINAEATTALVAFFSNMQSFNKMSPDWVYALPSTLKAHACEVLTEKWLPAREELQRAWCDNYLTVWIDTLSKLPEEPFPIPPTPGLPEKVSRRSMLEILSRSVAECAQGVRINHEYCTFVGRKTM